ncbi:hypothetical protein [Kangiella sp. HZ709]|uniref:hypothetical protein n=1 Tax=Kangiella sp. HZ709 TaxID=2666328 RepID=UPI0012B13EDC|nr:hypothetical protein [Kangiella sp. HZ709]MRX27039.1 hypothetical protein [Kangiella sp. HZ709]
MISFFRNLYAGFFSFSEAKNWGVSKQNVSVYISALRIACYIGIMMVLHLCQVYSVDYYSKWIPIIAIVVIETLLSNFISGAKKHDMIMEKFSALSPQAKKTYQVLGLALTPIAFSALLIIMTVFRDVFLKANY